MLANLLWLPLDISVDGFRVDRLIHILHWFMLLLFVGWGCFFVYCLFKFRQRPGHTAIHESVKSKIVKSSELGVIVFEAFLLVVLSMPVWAAYKSEMPDEGKNPMRVRVYAQQFAWNIQYPGPDGKFGRRDVQFTDEVMNPAGLDPNDPAGEDDVTATNQFYVVKDRPTIVELTSRDVIHSFAVPMLRVKQDVIPGMMIPIWFTATRTNEEVRKEMTRTISVPRSESGDFKFRTRNVNRMLMADAKDAEGNVVMAKDTVLSDDSAGELRKAGVTEITVAPRDPIDIQCAQLCGLGHYRMRGSVFVVNQADFDEWAASAGVEEFFDE